MHVEYSAVCGVISGEYCLVFAFLTVFYSAEVLYIFIHFCVKLHSTVECFTVFHIDIQ